MSGLHLQGSWVPVGQLGGLGHLVSGSLSQTKTILSHPFIVTQCADELQASGLICTLQSTLCVEGSAPDYLVFQGDDIVGPRPTSSCTVVGYGEWGCLLSQSFAAPSMTTWVSSFSCWDMFRDVAKMCCLTLGFTFYEYYCYITVSAHYCYRFV